MLELNKISKAFANYGFGSILQEPKFIKGDVDYNYIISSETGKYFLKYIVNKPNLQQFEFLGLLHEYLREGGIPVPNIFRAANGHFVQNEFILYEFIEGDIKNNWSDEEIVSLSRNFAKMHTLLEKYEVPGFIKFKDDKYIRGGGIKYCHEVFRARVLDLSVSKEIIDPIVQTIDTLYGKLGDFESLPKSLVHGDLNEMNAIFKNGKNVGIVDFGIGYEPIVYDLGEMCYWFAYPWSSLEFNHERFNTIMDAYETIRPISNLERQLLPFMMLRRSMMDIMLALQWYWDSAPGTPIPHKTLVQKIKHNNKLLDLIGKVKKKP